MTQQTLNNEKTELLTSYVAFVQEAKNPQDIAIQKIF